MSGAYKNRLNRNVNVNSNRTFLCQGSEKTGWTEMSMSIATGHSYVIGVRKQAEPKCQ